MSQTIDLTTKQLQNHTQILFWLLQEQLAVTQFQHTDVHNTMRASLAAINPHTNGSPPEYITIHQPLIHHKTAHCLQGGYSTHQFDMHTVQALCLSVCASFFEDSRSRISPVFVFCMYICRCTCSYHQQ